MSVDFNRSLRYAPSLSRETQLRADRNYVAFMRSVRDRARRQLRREMYWLRRALHRVRSNTARARLYREIAYKQWCLDHIDIHVYNISR